MRRSELWAKLTPEERVELVSDLWDSMAPEDVPPLASGQKAELDRPHAEHLHDPSGASKWEDVKARLLARYE